MPMTTRETLLAYYAVGRNMTELAQHGRILTDVERKGVKAIEAKLEVANAAGWKHAVNGGKLKDNPHEGGAPEWWAWNNAYKAAKKEEADTARLLKQGSKG